MKLRALLSLLANLWLLLCSAKAQINVELHFQRSTFLVDEQAPASLRITNMAGRDITLGNDTGGEPWCQIQVSAVRGESPSPRPNNPVFPPLFIRAGETIARSVNVTDVYDISIPGQYRVKASLVTGQSRNVTVTAPAYITVDPGKMIWNTTVGVPDGKPGQGGTRTFSAIQLQRKEGIFLYAKLEDRESGWRFPPYLLGRMLSAMQPQAQIDKDNNLYVFHAVDDETYMLSQVDVASGRSGQAIYRSKTPRAGRPSLQRQADTGKLVITGGIRVRESDLPSQTGPERAKLSDRPEGF
jgi:hypothetical protein